jgi:hypothetical protein
MDKEEEPEEDSSQKEQSGEYPDYASKAHAGKNQSLLIIFLCEDLDVFEETGDRLANIVGSRGEFGLIN